MVIEVLASILEGDPRHGAALSAIVDALNEHEHYGIRSAAIAGINQMSNGRPLSERALSVLQNAALSDEYVSIRLEAIELLAKQELDEARKQIIGESLAQRGIGKANARSLATSAVQFLTCGSLSACGRLADQAI